MKRVKIKVSHGLFEFCPCEFSQYIYMEWYLLQYMNPQLMLEINRFKSMASKIVSVD